MRLNDARTSMGFFGAITEGLDHVTASVVNVSKQVRSRTIDNLADAAGNLRKTEIKGDLKEEKQLLPPAPPGTTKEEPDVPAGIDIRVSYDPVNDTADKTKIVALPVKFPGEPPTGGGMDQTRLTEISLKLTECDSLSKDLGREIDAALNESKQSKPLPEEMWKEAHVPWTAALLPGLARALQLRCSVNGARARRHLECSRFL